MKPRGFPPERRIRKRSGFLEAYAAGRKYHSAHYLLFALRRPGEPQRVGIAASRKVGCAVERNRAKRMLREFFRALDFCLPGMQIAAVVKKGAPDLQSSAVAGELMPIMERLAGSRAP